MKSISPLEVLVRHAWKDQPGFLQRFADSLPSKKQGLAIQRIFTCLRRGENTHGILDRLQDELSLDKTLWDSLLEVTRRQERLRQEVEHLKVLQRQAEELEEERRKFRPYLYVLSTERRPTMSITLYGLAGLGRRRFLPVDPQWLRESGATQQEWIKERIQQHYAESNGLCPGMGQIRGYEYRCRWEEAWLFSNAGVFREKFLGQPIHSHSEVHLGSRLLTSSPG